MDNKLNYVLDRKKIVSFDYYKMIKLFRYFKENITEAEINFPRIDFGFKNPFADSIYDSSIRKLRDPNIEEIHDFDKYWGTYDGYTEIVISKENKKVYSTVKIRNRIYILRELEEYLKMTVKFEIPVSMVIEMFSNQIHSSLDSIMEEEYEQHLEEQKNAWKKKRITRLFRG